MATKKTINYLNIDLTGGDGLPDNISQAVYKTVAEPHLNYSVGDSEMAVGVYNPLMRPGYLHPANDSALTLVMPSVQNEFTCALSDPVAGLVLGNQNEYFYTYEDSFVSGVPTYTYEHLDGVKLQAVTANNGGLTSLIIYQVNGVRKLFFTTQSLTGNVGIATDSLASADSNWLSTICLNGTVLNGTGANAFLRKSDNGLLYVFDDYSVHTIDGTLTGGANGTANMNVLTFPENVYRISDAVDTRGKLFIALNGETNLHQDFNDKNLDKNYTNDCGVYIWNRISSILTMQDYVAVESCLRINRIWVGPEGNIFLNTIGTNGNNQIRLFNGSSFEIIKELPFETKISQKDGLLVAENMTWWAAIDGYLYAAKYEGQKYKVFRIFKYFTGTLSSSAGTVITYLGADSFTADTGYRTSRPSIVIAYRATGAVDAVVKKYYIYGTGSITDNNGSDGSGYITPNPFPFKPNQGDVMTGVKILPQMSTVKDVIIRCIPTETGATTIATIKYYFNNSPIVSITKTVTMDEASKGYVSHAINKPFVNSIQMEIEWNTANTMGNNDFAPYVATVGYDDTTTYSNESD